jgi:GTP-binding protein Era
MNESITKSGIVAISGQPNVGKSTILNGLIREKVAIVSPRPETTRDNIRGILTEDDMQIVFIDTPGIHHPHDLLGKVMLTRAQSTLMEAELILLVTEKKLAFNTDDQRILERLPSPDEGKKVILIINKVDKVKDKTTLLPLIQKAGEMYPFTEIIPICALKQPDLDRLLKALKSHIPEGPFLYDEDELTDKTYEFQVQEIIREKILKTTYEEVPHSVAVVIDQMKENPKTGQKEIFATVFLERPSQKAIIIGKGGEMIKKIRQNAQADIKKLFGEPVYIELWVKVSSKWKKNPNALREMGYSD